MINKPFFSIVIPTFERAEKLKRAIACILLQDFKDFELIIFDNNSQDNTEDVVRSFKDKRIKYYKNNKNVGWIINLKRGISFAEGEYIILHGDDDFILYPDALKKVNLFIGEGKYGFIRLNYLSIMPQKNIAFDFHKTTQDDFEIKPKEDKKKIVDYITKIDPFFITGIVFKNNFPKNVAILDSEFVPWFNIIFYDIYHYGGCFAHEYFFAASWSQNASHLRYQLSGGKFRFEKYFTETSRLLGKIDYKEFLNNRLKIIIREFPAAKYYTGNKDLSRFARRVLELQPDYKRNFEYWFWLYFSLLTPKKVLSFIRKHIFFKMIADANIPFRDKIHKRIDYINHLV